MTKVKQFLGVLMAAMLCFALTPAAAFADNGNSNDTKGEITIENAIDGKRYDAYQILQLESFNTDKGAYSYKATPEWQNWLETMATQWVTVDDNGYVTWIEGADAKTFADEALAYAKGTNEQPVISPTATTTATTTYNGETPVTTAKFTGLSLGYYLVDSSVGVLCALGTTDPSMVITEKNGVPQIDKQVQEDSKISEVTEGWGTVNDATIGDTVNFKSKITVAQGTKDYVFKDTMSQGLTFNIESVVINGEALNPYNNTNANFYMGSYDTNSFTVVLNNTAWVMEQEEIVIEYSATLNADAIVNAPGNKNSCTLSYSNGSETIETPAAETTTYTWQMSVFKHDSNNNSLAGAKFTLSYNGTQLGLAQVPGTTEYKVDPSAILEDSIIETDDTGRFVISGLDADTYVLTEIAAPDGYNMPADPNTNVVVGKDSDQNSDGTYKIAEVDVLNQAGSVLPSTGGMGTTIFYIVGAVLVIGAVVFLVRRRSSATK